MKKNKAYIIVASIIFVIGLILLLISAILNGWDFMKWIHDKRTISGIVIVGSIACIGGVFYLKGKVADL